MRDVFKNQKICERYCWYSIWYPIILCIFIHFIYYSEISLTVAAVVSDTLWTQKYDATETKFLYLYLYLLLLQKIHEFYDYDF